jgi:hypothetical protein
MLAAGLKSDRPRLATAVKNLPLGEGQIDELRQSLGARW